MYVHRRYYTVHSRPNYGGTGVFLKGPFFSLSFGTPAPNHSMCACTIQYLHSVSVHLHTVGRSNLDQREQCSMFAFAQAEYFSAFPIMSREPLHQPEFSINFRRASGCRAGVKCCTSHSHKTQYIS